MAKEQDQGILRAAAGFAQIKKGRSKPGYITSAFDAPEDQEQINRGIGDALHRCY